jgi:gliding motility-associated-like protein
MYSVTVENAEGCSGSSSVQVRFTPGPQISAGPDLTLTCQQNGQNIGPANLPQGATYNWSGPGITSSNRNIPNPVIDQPGSYILEMTTAGGCSVQDTVLVFQDETIPEASAGPDKEITCESNTAILEGGSSMDNVIYQWSGPGITPVNKNDQFPEVSAPGHYTLTVIEATTGCRSNEASVQVTADDGIPAILIEEIGALDCYTTAVTLDANGSSSGDQYQVKWITPSGTTIDSLMEITVSEGGLYTLTIIDTINGCSASESMMVEDLREYPTANAGQPKELDCHNSLVSLNGGNSSRGPNHIYNWEGPEGGILNDPNLISVAVEKGGRYILTVTDTINGCASSDSVLVTENFDRPIASLPELVELDCFEERAILDGSASSSGENILYRWEVLSGQLTGSRQNITAQTEQEGLYILHVINSESSCEASDTVRVIRPDRPSGAEVNIEPSCFGQNNGSINVRNITGGESPYLLSLNGEPFSVQDTFQPLAPGNYELVIQDVKGCDWQTTVSVQERPVIDIQLTPQITIKLGRTTQLEVEVNIPPLEISQINWTPADSLSCSDCLNPTAGPYTTTTYGVRVQDVYGCMGEESVTVLLDDRPDVYVPNVFSPNGDGINDRFVIYAGPGIERIVELKIFDRWGNQVFEIYDFQPNEVNFGWDGNFRGQPMNPAVFAWFTIVETIDGRNVILKGDLTLVR